MPGDTSGNPRSSIQSASGSMETLDTLCILCILSIEMSLINPNALVISQTDGRPMYLQIVEQIQQRVVAGDWPTGSELPSIRQLAVALRVSVITVKRAYYELEREGVIVTQQGKGSTVAANPRARSQQPPRTLALPALPLDTEFARHLAELVRLGALRGWTPEELAARVRDEAESWKREREERS